MKRLSVLLPVHWCAIMGGSQYQAKVLIERLLDGYDVDIHYLTVQCNPNHHPEGYAIHRFSSRRGIRRYGYFFDAIRLYRALRKLRPDVVYQQVGCAHTGIAAYYARRHGASMMWRVSSDRSLMPGRIPWWKIHQRIERAFLEYGIRKAHIISTQTKWQQARLAEHYGRRDAEVIRNFHPMLPRPKGNTPRRTVVWIANLKPLKNPHAFVRLAASFGSGADARGADVRFVMIGAAMLNDQWTKELLSAVDSVPNLEYRGARSQEEVNEALREARVLVNTSDYEGFSNTFIQAWMLEVPVVSLHVNPDGLLSEHGLGFVARTEAQLQRDVQRLIEDDRLAADIGGRCRDYALRNHSIENADRVAALLGLERKATERTRPGLVEDEGRNQTTSTSAPGADSCTPAPGRLVHAPDSALRQ